MSKELSADELREYTRDHQDAGVHRYVEIIQDESRRLLERHERLQRIETSAAGRRAVLQFGACATFAVLLVLAFLFGRWFG